MAMLPEEYAVVLTVFPALGARRLAKEGVLTRRISAIETLGATTVLCSDKTGTLTENRMTVTHLAAGGVGLPDRLALDTVTEGQLPEAFHGLVEVAILASVVDPFDPMEKPSTNSASASCKTPSTCTATGASCRPMRSARSCARCRTCGRRRAKAPRPWLPRARRKR
jgi:P-type E1-E2 ATPase